MAVSFSSRSNGRDSNCSSFRKYNLRNFLQPGVETAQGIYIAPCTISSSHRWARALQAARKSSRTNCSLNRNIAGVCLRFNISRLLQGATSTSTLLADSQITDRLRRHNLYWSEQSTSLLYVASVNAAAAAASRGWWRGRAERKETTLSMTKTDFH